jgi:hypothetical protein
LAEVKVWIWADCRLAASGLEIEDNCRPRTDFKAAALRVLKGVAAPAGVLDRIKRKGEESGEQGSYEFREYLRTGIPLVAIMVTTLSVILVFTYNI